MICKKFASGKYNLQFWNVIYLVRNVDGFIWTTLNIFGRLGLFNVCKKKVIRFFLRLAFPYSHRQFTICKGIISFRLQFYTWHSLIVFSFIYTWKKEKRRGKKVGKVKWIDIEIWKMVKTRLKHMTPESYERCFEEKKSLQQTLKRKKDIEEKQDVSEAKRETNSNSTESWVHLKKYAIKSMCYYSLHLNYLVFMAFSRGLNQVWDFLLTSFE